MDEICKVQKQSLEGGVSRTLGGTDTGLTVSGGLVGKRELSKIPSNHIELDFNRVEDFAVVDSDEVTDHFGHYDAISKMSFDDGGFLTGLAVLLSLFAFIVEPVISMLDFWDRTKGTSGESSSLSGSEKFNDLFSCEGIDLFGSVSSE
jgi:hypothetical protein